MRKNALPGAEQALAIPGLPEGWRVKANAGGVLRLTEARSRRTIRGMGVLCLGIAWDVAFWSQAQEVRSALAPGAPGLRLLALLAQVLVGVVLAASALWLLCGREEWRLGHGVIIVYRGLCGWRWERRFVEGWFRLITDADGNNHLLVQPPGGAPTILCRGTAADFAQMARFGAYLAAQCNWALREEGTVARIAPTATECRSGITCGINASTPGGSGGSAGIRDSECD